MLKVLIYSSKELYDSATFEGRAEAHVIAYRDGDYYRILKNKTNQYMADSVVYYTMYRLLEWAERDLWQNEKNKYV